MAALFANKNKGAWEELKVEKMRIINIFSFHVTLVMFYNVIKNGTVRFENKNRGAWEHLKHIVE